MGRKKKLPESRSQTRGHGQKIEIIAATTMGTLAVGCFVAEAVAAGPTATKLETSLFNVLQFVLTVGFSWFTSRAISRSDFEASLKRFAISAYRRVADVEQIVKRLNSEVRRVLQNRPNDPDLRAVEAVVRDCSQIVRSSISDWSDVIGEELLALETVRRLQKERDALDADRQDHGKEPRTLQTQLESQIEEIQQALPPGLRLKALEGREPESDLFAATWLARQYEADDGLELTVVTGDIYDHDRDRTSLKRGDQLVVHRTADGALDACDIEGMTLGRVQNPTPLAYDEFVGAFTRCFGDRTVSLQYVADHGEERRNGELYAWFTVKVISKPVIDTDLKRNLERASRLGPRQPNDQDGR